MENDRINSATAQQMRDPLSDLLNGTAHLRELTPLTRQGKAVAVLVSVEDWEQYLRMKTVDETREAEAAGQTSESAQEGVGSENGKK